MNNLTICKRLFLFFTLVSIAGFTYAQGTNTWTEKNAAKWVNKRDWANGLKLKVHPSVNKITFAEQYHKNKAVWDKAIAFLRDSDLAALKPGKYVIDGDNAYATITDAPSKTFEQSAWESHRKYIDLQYVIRGKENIGVTPAATAIVTSPYDESKDIAHYTSEGKYYLAEPGTFFLFFPADAHRPNIKVDGFDVVKKLVIKINVVN